MMLIWPLVSRIAHWTSSRCAISCSARRLGDLLDREPLPLEVPLDRLPVLDDDQRLALEDRTGTREAEREPREPDLEDGDRADDEDGAR